MLKEIDYRRILFLRTLMLEDKLSRTGWQPILEQIGPKIRKQHDAIPNFYKYFSISLQDRLTQRHRFNLTAYYQRRSASTAHKILLWTLVFILGLATNYLGGKRVVNLWLNPFMAFLAWNFLIFLTLILRRGFRTSQIPEDGFILQSINRCAQWLISQWKRHLVSLRSDPKFAILLGRVQFLFQRDWIRLFPKLVLNRLASQLHIMAVFLATGVIAGLYLRGFAESYQFGWDSTFIDAESRTFWLGTLFSPILWLAGPLFPNGLPAFEPGNGSAWIHLFALTAFIYIIVPRLVLGYLAHRRAQKQEKSLQLPWQDATWQQVYAASDPKPLPLHLIFYSYDPGERQLDRLIKNMRETLPGKLEKGMQYQIAWGQTDEETITFNEAGIWMLLFNGAQTPESEIHGEFCRHLLQTLKTSAHRQGLLVVVDTEKIPPSRQKSGKDGWSKLLRSHGFDHFVLLALGEQPSEAINQHIKDAVLWFAT